MAFIVRGNVGETLSGGLAGQGGELIAGVMPGTPCRKGRFLRGLIALFLGIATGLSGVCVAVGQPTADSSTFAVRGVVRDTTGKPVGDVEVRLERTDQSSSKDGTTTADGSFELQPVSVGSYVLTAQKAGWRSRRVDVTVDPAKEGNPPNTSVEIVLEPDGNAKETAAGKSVSTADGMEFSDSPSFTIAAVTDWTAAGGHGSDAILRTSESLTRDAVKLKGSSENAEVSRSPEMRRQETALRAALEATPSDFNANARLGSLYLKEARYKEAIPLLNAAHRANPDNYTNEYERALALQGAKVYGDARLIVRDLLDKKRTAELLRLAGELDEELGNPVASVNEFEEAVREDGSEENYFRWGSELLLHRAILQARDVFNTGAQRYPKSARMLTALGAALFASSNYEEAARRLCQAADMGTNSDEPYLFLGRAEVSSPDPLPCAEGKLADFVKRRPENPLASYYDAMAIWKQSGRSADPKTLEQVEALLNKAVAIDSKCGDAYLQLGNLNVARHDNATAISFYGKAIEANPRSAEAHYRLGMAYDRVGDREKAKQEFQIHEDLDKEQAAEVERQRREVKQFLVKGSSSEGANP